MARVRWLHRLSRDLMSVHVSDPSQLDYEAFPKPPPRDIHEWAEHWTGPRVKAKKSEQPSEDQHVQ